MSIERGMSSFKNLINRNAVFQIPTYQRNYSWESGQLEDLWNDLFYLENNRKHFLGTILLRNTSKKIKRGINEFEVYDIIDGQQRMVTSLILLKNLFDKLYLYNDLKDQINRERELYLKFIDIYKVKLLGDDEKYFIDNILENLPFPDEILTPSQKRLKNALIYFNNKIKELNNRESLENIKLKIDSMEILVYPIEKESDAARMFTIINDRGKLLSNLERTKSFLMYTIYLCSPEEKLEQDLEDINKRFSNIFKNVMSIEKSRWGKISEDEIQRYHFITYVTKAEIDTVYNDKRISSSSREKASSIYMDMLKEKITQLYRIKREECRNTVLNYIIDLENSFIALREMATYNENDRTYEILSRIFSLGRLGNFYPLLIVSWIRYKNDKEKLNEILSLVEKFVFRVYLATGTRSYAARNNLYNLAFASKKSKFDLIKQKLKEILLKYAYDEKLKTSLESSQFYLEKSSRDIRYILYEYDKHLREIVKEPLPLDLTQILSTGYDVEHIWAKDAAKLNLNESELKVHQANVHRLGNLTIASESWNRSWGNDPFSNKKNKYRESAFRVQKELTNFNIWEKEQIDTRQKILVNFILNRWSV